jgi:hypothetical protein
MKFLTGQRQKKYSIERLRRLYGDLLRLLDIENRNDLWELRHQEAETSPRFALGRKAFLFKEPETNEKTEQRRKDLASAFFALAASRSVEGRQNSQAAFRDEATVSALQMAKSLETSVIHLIRSIGEVVVNAEGSSGGTNGLRSDQAFEYFW